jgi:hypothetical protein
MLVIVRGIVAFDNRYPKLGYAPDALATPLRLKVLKNLVLWKRT